MSPSGNVQGSGIRIHRGYRPHYAREGLTKRPISRQ